MSNDINPQGNQQPVQQGMSPEQSFKISQVPLNAGADEEEGINLRDFFVKCLSNWKWFVISILACLFLAGFYILKTPKTYTRTASVVVKDEESGASSSISQSLSDLGLFQTSSNVANELLAFQSPALIGDVVERLGLQTNYSYKRRLRPVTLYGDSLIVVADFVGMAKTDGASFKLDILGKGKAKIYDLIHGPEKYDEEYEFTLGDTVKTPAGPIVVTPGPNYKTEFDYTIHISRMPLATAITAYQAKVTAALADDDATVIDFTMQDVCVPREVNFLNTLIDIYNEKWIDDKEQMAVATSNFINDRLAVIERELGNVDSDIANYKGENLLPDVAQASEMFMTNVNENNKRQLEVSTQIAILQYVVEYMEDPANNLKLLPSNAGIEKTATAVNEQIKLYNEEILNRQQLLTTTGESSPLVKDCDLNINSMKGALIATINQQIRAYQTELNTLIRNDRENNQKIATSPSQAKYLLSVERQQKVKEELYLFLLQKREENELSLAFTPSNIRVITPPMGPILPTAPVTRNIMLIAFVIGLLLPAIVIFIADNLNNRVRSRADLENMSAPFIGEIPEAHVSNYRLKRWKRQWRDFMGKGSKLEEAPQLLVHAHGRSIINESFRMVRSNLEFITRRPGNKVIMVTSFNPGSGKSFISLNLSAALAVKKKGSRILMIDLDLRRASLSRAIDDRSKGISNYLSEDIQDIHSVIKPTTCEGLYLIPVGAIPPNPAELLYSDRLQNALDELKAEYDLIILDCPPAEIVADTTIITPLADITLFVLRAGLLDRRLLPELNNIYASHRYNNLLVLLNGTTAAGSSYKRYSYYSYYSSRKEKEQ